jgi:hypothetical protein
MACRQSSLAPGSGLGFWYFLHSVALAWLIVVGLVVAPGFG